MPGPRYAIIVSRFPKLTETFVLQELQGLEDRGLDFELYSIIHESPEQMQPEAADLDRRANYIQWRSLEVVRAQWHWLRRSPGRYLRTWWLAWRTAFGSRDALVRTPLLVCLAAAMARRMTDQGVQRVHSHWATYPTTCALLIEELAGIPFSFTGHAHDIFIDRVGLQTKVDRAGAVLTCTDHGRGILIDEATDPARAARTVRLIHHGVRLQLFAQLPFRERSEAEVFAVVCVAALQEYKGHRYLFAAMAELQRTGTPCRLVCIGDGELRTSLVELAGRLGIDVDFLGRQPSERVREELAGADCFALASIQLDSGWMDGIPNVCVEAMAMGRPVVASSLPGIRELVIDGETGLLATSRDPADLARQLRRIATEPDLAERCVAGGRAKVESEHDCVSNLDEVMSILAGLPVRPTESEPSQAGAD